MQHFQVVVLLLGRHFAVAAKPKPKEVQVCHNANKVVELRTHEDVVGV